MSRPTIGLILHEAGQTGRTTTPNSAAILTRPTLSGQR